MSTPKQKKSVSTTISNATDKVQKGFEFPVLTQEAHALASTATHENVYLFVPNLIGYLRVILAAVAMHWMPYHPRYSTWIYGASSFLDAADGYAARVLDQSSEFGAVLDMVTDRCTTACLLCYLALQYPPYALVFQALIALDFASHYMHMCSTLTTGSRRHKVIEKDRSRILSWYYNKKVLFTLCAGNELFFVALYLMKYDHTPISYLLPRILVDHVTAIAPSIFKPFFNISYPQFVGIVVFPISLLKNIINVIQMWKASKVLVGVDLAERAKLRAAKKQ